MEISSKNKPNFSSNYCRSSMDDYPKKFFLFSGSNHYPMGGWEDYKGDFVSIEEALSHLRRNIEIDEKNWYHIINIDTQDIVKKYPEDRGRRNI